MELPATHSTGSASALAALSATTEAGSANRVTGTRLVVRAERGAIAVSGESIVRMVIASELKEQMILWGEAATVRRMTDLGIKQGCALEMNPGRGSVGLEWLRRTEGTTLLGLESNPEMISVARRSAERRGLSARADYFHGDGGGMPFEDETFDAVFSINALHEWVNPLGVFRDIWRVLKPHGNLFICDFRRDLSVPLTWLLWGSSVSRMLPPRFVAAVEAAYTVDELRNLRDRSRLKECRVYGNPFSLVMIGEKANGLS